MLMCLIKVVPHFQTNDCCLPFSQILRQFSQTQLKLQNGAELGKKLRSWIFAACSYLVGGNNQQDFFYNSVGEGGTDQKKRFLSSPQHYYLSQAIVRPHFLCRTVHLYTDCHHQAQYNLLWIVTFRRGGQIWI